MYYIFFSEYRLFCRTDILYIGDLLDRFIFYLYISSLDADLIREKWSELCESPIKIADLLKKTVTCCVEILEDKLEIKICQDILGRFIDILRIEKSTRCTGGDTVDDTAYDEALLIGEYTLFRTVLLILLYSIDSLPWCLFLL
jgi:hypothetical protein